MPVSITTGKVLFNNCSAEVKCYIFDPVSRKELSLYGFTKGKKFEKTINGLKVISGQMSDARRGIPRDRGGYWVTSTIDNTEPLLFKIQVSITGFNKNRKATFYAITRKGGAVGNALFTQVPRFNDDRQLERTTMSILSGQFELIDLDLAETIYRFNIPNIFRVQAKKSMISGLVNIEELKPATIAPPSIKVAEVTLGNGKQVNIARRQRKPLKISPKTNLTKEEK